MGYSQLSDKAKKIAQEFGYSPSFGEKETLAEAYEYARELISRKEFNKVRPTITIALHVLINTMAVEAARRVEETIPDAKTGG